MNDIDRLLQLSVKSVTELTKDVIVILDKTGNILFLNNRMIIWLGYNEEELVGKNIAFAGLMTPNSVRIALSNLALRFLGREIAPYEVEFITKNKTILKGVISASLILDENGKSIADLVVITDITEKQEFEKALNVEKEKTENYIKELEKMNELMIGRELKMTELKEEIKKLKNQ